MDPTDDANVTTAMRAITRYLRDNPQACDTVEGIWRWWLAGDDVDYATVQRALDDLAIGRIVDVLTAADGVRRYRLAAASQR